MSATIPPRKELRENTAVSHSDLFPQFLPLFTQQTTMSKVDEIPNPSPSQLAALPRKMTFFPSLNANPKILKPEQIKQYIKELNMANNPCSRAVTYGNTTTYYPNGNVTTYYPNYTNYPLYQGLPKQRSQIKLNDLSERQTFVI